MRPGFEAQRFVSEMEEATCFMPSTKPTIRLNFIYWLSALYILLLTPTSAYDSPNTTNMEYTIFYENPMGKNGNRETNKYNKNN